jgi:hypothetical protein
LSENDSACTSLVVRNAVFHAGREAEGQTEVLLPGQRLRAHLLQLGHQMIGGERRALRAGLASGQTIRGEHRDVGARLRGGRRRGLRAGEGRRKEREGERGAEQLAGHGVLSSCGAARP